MLSFLDKLESSNKTAAKTIATYLLYRFADLRDASHIPLSQISRLSLEQYEALLDGMLRVQSGGLIPVLLVVAFLRTVKSCFQLKWDIEFHGINVSDKASGAGGDVTVTQAGEAVLAIEITERQIEKSRVVSTFNTKIMRGGIGDYLFLYSAAAPHEEARKVARTYFSQGHEINFVPVNEWIINNLVTLGAKCRRTFTKEFLARLEDREVPASVKMAWNDQVRHLVGS